MAGLRNLLDVVADFIEKELDPFEYPVRPDSWDNPVEERRKIKVYKMRMPNADDAQQEVPYILLQLLGGEDKRSKQNNHVYRQADIRIIITLYDKDPREGSLASLNIVELLRNRMLRKRIFDGYELIEPFEFVIYPDDTLPYHLAEINTTWKLPDIEMDVSDELGKYAWAESFLHDKE